MPTSPDVLTRPRTDAQRRVVVAKGIGTADRVAAALTSALADPDAHAVLLVDAGVDIGPAAVRAAAERLAADDAVDVIAWRRDGDPASCVAALLPLDAVRAVGLAHAGLTRAALADLVLRADAAGFRAVDATDRVDASRAAGPTARDRILLALLHEPVAARGRVLRAGLLTEARSLLAGRRVEVAARHRDLAAVLAAPAADERTALREGGALVVPGGVLQRSWTLHVRLWFGWARLRRIARAGAFEGAAPEAWATRRSEAVAPVTDTRTDGERGRAEGRPQDVRWRPWSTTRRGSSAA
ncbi:hypothetical protein [uncultured Amnibacterium sp.]|uniref:hypothetical protein n=1 Tax=uncultured Amnibacterium sp. TaxID=1631851 RepID=UPI0035CA8B12